MPEIVIDGVRYKLDPRSLTFNVKLEDNSLDDTGDFEFDNGKDLTDNNQNEGNIP